MKRLWIFQCSQSNDIEGWRHSCSCSFVRKLSQRSEVAGEGRYENSQEIFFLVGNFLKTSISFFYNIVLQSERHKRKKNKYEKMGNFFLHLEFHQEKKKTFFHFTTVLKSVIAFKLHYRFWERKTLKVLMFFFRRSISSGQQKSPSVLTSFHFRMKKKTCRDIQQLAIR